MMTDEEQIRLDLELAQLADQTEALQHAICVVHHRVCALIEWADEQGSKRNGGSNDRSERASRPGDRH